MKASSLAQLVEFFPDRHPDLIPRDVLFVREKPAQFHFASVKHGNCVHKPALISDGRR